MAKSGFKTAKKGGGHVTAGIFMSVVALGVLCAAVWAFLFCESCRPRDLDAELCPKETGPISYVAVVIDMTDRVSPRAQTEIGKVLKATIDAMEPGTKLGLYLVQDQTAATPDGAVRVAALCHPGSGVDVNILTESARDAQDTFERDFLAPVDAALTEMLAAETANTSPIVEALRVATTDLLPFGRPDVPQSILLVSDMVQNSAAFSFFRDDSWDGFSQLDRQALAASIDDVEMQLIHILRTEIWEKPRSFDESDVMRFWQNLLAEGRVRRVTTLAEIPAR